MNDIVQFYTTTIPRRHDTESRLLEEIAFLESRLVAFDHSGDNAYEKAMVRSYNALLNARRDQLSALLSA